MTTAPSDRETANPVPEQSPVSSSDGVRTTEQMRSDIIEMLHTVYDPEIPVDIYELGLIYKVDVLPEGQVYVEMTLTSPACPVAGTLPPEVQEKVATVDGVADVRVEVVWDPPWEPGMMSEEARLALGFM